MSRILLLLCASLTLAGCARLADRSYGSWLDREGVPPRVAAPLEPAHATALRTEARQLELQAETLRVKLAVEPDRVKRVDMRRELREIYDRVTPIQHALRHGPTPTLQPTASPSDPGA